MEGTKYIGMDVHKDSISIAVLNSSGKLVMERIIETKAITILEFVHGLRGSLHLTFEEGTWAAWLYDLLKPHVTKLVVCDPRRNFWLSSRSGNLLLFVAFTSFFRVFSPKIACQVPKPPNSLKPKKIELAF